LQDEFNINLYDYGARNYDPAIGRWFNVDPLAEDYVYWSPYVFSGNRVIDAREIEGLEPDKPTQWDSFEMEMDFASSIAGGINEVRKGVANIGARIYNIFSDTPTDNQYIVNDSGQLELTTGLTSETRMDMLKNVGKDLVGIGLTFLGGPEGSLMAKGLKTPAMGTLGKVVNGNSKSSTKAQHVYEIFEKGTDNVVKTGISGGKVSKADKSYRATSQVNKLNKAEGAGKYDSRIVDKIPAGQGARQKALNSEASNANKLRSQGQLKDKKYHQRP